MKKLMIVLSLVFSTSAFADNQVVSRDELDQQMANFNKKLSEARAVPEMKNGKIVGYRKVSTEDSNYKNLELKQGEVVTLPNTGTN